MEPITRRLTYANAMATIAVFGVLAGGGAYAASKIGAGDIAKNAVRSKHIKKNAVKTPKIKNGAVTEAKLAEEFESVAAYAQIEGGGSVEDDLSFNIDDDDVTSPSTGVYCIGGLPFEPKNAVATPEATSAVDSQDVTISVLLSGPGSIPFGCATGDRIRVQVIDHGLLGASAAGFTDNYVFIWVED
jgi:hypothetical protein